jgi:hypothetical protein
LKCSMECKKQDIRKIRRKKKEEEKKKISVIWFLRIHRQQNRVIWLASLFWDKYPSSPWGFTLNEMSPKFKSYQINDSLRFESLSNKSPSSPSLQFLLVVPHYIQLKGNLSQDNPISSLHQSHTVQNCHNVNMSAYILKECIISTSF